MKLAFSILTLAVLLPSIANAQPPVTWDGQWFCKTRIGEPFDLSTEPTFGGKPCNREFVVNEGANQTLFNGYGTLIMGGPGTPTTVFGCDVLDKNRGARRNGSGWWVAGPMRQSFIDNGKGLGRVEVAGGGGAGKQTIHYFFYRN